MSVERWFYFFFFFFFFWQWRTLLSFYVFYHLLEQQVKYSTKRSVLNYQHDVLLVLIYCQQNYVMTNVLQHCEWFHQCAFLYNCIYLYKFCMEDVNYDLLIEKVILLSLLTILQQYHIWHLMELLYKSFRSNFVLLSVRYF